MSSSTDQTILSASGFVNSIGVNTHVSYAWGAYNDLALVEADLSYLGVTKLRDSVTNIPSAQPVLDGLAAAGYKFDLGVSSSVPASGTAGLQQYVQALNTFAANHPGSIIAVEGLNEVNLQPFSYEGSSSLSAAAQFQSAYYNAIKADAALSGVPVYNLTVAYNDSSAYSQLGNMTGSSDYANVHAYASTSVTPASVIQADLAAAAKADPGKPTVITETGYTTQANTPYLGADQAVQAKSILNTLADAYQAGVSTTYLYQLLDLNSSSSDTNPEDHYGLFNSDGTPKLAATAVHNLTTILSDNGTGGHTPTTPLGYSLSNMPVSSHSMVLGKSNGAYDLVIWAEPKMWNPSTSTEISNPSQPVTVDLGGVHQSVNVYDPMNGTSPIASYSNVSSITVPISDHPVIIEIDAPATTPVTAPQPSDVSGTAVDIVAQLATLNASSALQQITLTDTHVLPVASTSTMEYIISHYGKALAAVQGGYSFSVTNSTSAWSETQYFDASGTLTSTSTSNFDSNGVITSKLTVNIDAATSSDTVIYSHGVESLQLIVNTNGSKETISYDGNGQMTADTVQNADGSLSTTIYANGAKSKVYTTNADGTHLNTFYGVTGQAYTTQIQHLDARGALTALTQLHADGSLQYAKVVNADGSTTVDLYNGVGQKTTEIVTHTDGSNLTTSYAASGTVAQIINHAADGGVTTTNFTAGVEASVYVTTAAGVKESWQFTNGHVTSGSIQNTDGSSSTTLYDSNGEATAVYATNHDGTHTDYFYHITGQPYVTQVQQTTASGSVTSVVDLHADGSREYYKGLNADGSTTTALYDGTGHKTSQIVSHTDGSSLTTTYDASGGVTQTVAVANGGVTTTNLSGGIDTSIYASSADGSKETKLFDASGNLTTDSITNPNGSASTSVYANGAKTKMYVTNADGSHDNYYYSSSGTEHDSYNTAGNLASTDFLSSNGTHTEAAKVAGITLTGGSVGGDTFTISSAGAATIDYTKGADQVFNFHAGTAANHDTIAIAQSLAADYNHLQITQSGADTLVHVAAGDTILLKNVSAASLNHGNFAFV